MKPFLEVVIYLMLFTIRHVLFCILWCLWWLFYTSVYLWIYVFPSFPRVFSTMLAVYESFLITMKPMGRSKGCCHRFWKFPRPCEIVANASEVDPKTVAMLGPKKIPWVWFPQVSCGWGSTDGFFQNLMGARFFFHAALHWNYLSMMCVKTIGCRDIDLAKRPCGSLILIMSSQPAPPGNRCIQNNSPSSARMASRVDILIHWLEPCLDECSHGIPPKLRKIADFALMGRPADPSSSEIGQLHEIMVSSAVHSDWILSLRLLIFWMAWFGVSFANDIDITWYYSTWHIGFFV